jgi:CelD/BcsL family acetyltransferase involved in cellulose biosynthesis
VRSRLTTCYDTTWPFFLLLESGCDPRPSLLAALPTHERLELRVYESLASLENLRTAWEELLLEFQGATVFSTLEWLGPWWRAFGSAQRLRVLGFFDSSGRLAALAPLSLADYRAPLGIKLKLLRMMGDGSGDSDNLDLPVRPGYEKRVVSTLLDYLTTAAFSWDFCQLNTLPDDSPCGSALLEELQGRQWTRFAEVRPRLAVEMPDNWEQYLRQLTSKERGKVGLRTRRLQKHYNVRYIKCTESALQPALDALFRLHQDRWQVRGESGSFASGERRQFYEELSHALLERGWLEFWLLELDGKEVAAQYGFRYGKTVFSLQEGFDLTHSSDSVGYVLRAHVLKQLIADGVCRYDFLAGQGEAKSRWGAQLGHYVDIHFARPWSLGAIYLQSLHRAESAKRQLRARLPPKAWTALHAVNVRLRGGRGRKPGITNAESQE